MTKIKCRKCGKVYPFDEKICPICGYDIREDPNLSGSNVEYERVSWLESQS